MVESNKMKLSFTSLDNYCDYDYNSNDNSNFCAYLINCPDSCDIEKKNWNCYLRTVVTIWDEI